MSSKKIMPRTRHDFIKVYFLKTWDSVPYPASLSMVRTLLRKVATPPHLSSELCFAKRSATAASFFAVHWSKHFATQNGLLSKFCYAKPPTASAVFAVFDRPVFFGVHTLRFIKGLT